MENTVLVGKLVAGVFATARGRYPELTDTWVRISHRLGSRLPASRLSVSIQREGEVDLVLRCIEDEMARGESNIFVGHYLGVLSAYWIGGTYETFRLLRDRKLNDDDERFSAV
jgi:hypothetical protein